MTSNAKKDPQAEEYFIQPLTLLNSTNHKHIKIVNEREIWSTG